MSYYNMVESQNYIKEATKELEKIEPALLSAENISDSIFKMEYTWDFLKLARDRDKIAWALSLCDSRIRAWHYDRGVVDRSYRKWRDELFGRFLDSEKELDRLIEFRQTKNQGLLDFLSEAKRIAKNVSKSEYYKAKIILGNIGDKCNRELVAMVIKDEGGKLSENALKVIERLIGSWKYVKRNNESDKSINMALSIKDEDDLYIKIEIEGKIVKALCDTGADLNLVDSSLIGSRDLSPTMVTARAASGHRITILGTVNLTIKVDGKAEDIEFVVGENLTTKCILGTPYLRKKKAVIKFNSVKEKNEDPDELKLLFERQRGQIKEVECAIETPPGKVVCVRPYQIAQSLEEKVIKEINGLKEKGYIVESKSSWCNNLVPVEKPDGSVRITVNFKMLNQLVAPDKYSLPRMDLIVHGLYGKMFFSKIDLKDGFFHIPIREQDRHKTAFRVKNKLYEWNVMPQGFINSPGIFQRYMDHALEGLIGKCCYVYVDDILVVGETESEHDNAFKEVTERLIKYGLRVNQKKVEYKVKRIKFLGHLIGQNKVSLDLEKEDSIRQMKSPKSKEEVQQFMGIINYYRKFISRCAEKSEELLKFLRKDVKFEWKEKEESAFQLLKSELMSEKVLRQPDFKREFILDTDASNTGIGAVLSQKFSDGEHPVIYLSRRLRDAELNYSITEKELLAAMWAMEQLHYYLYGRRFILRTDHKAILAYNAKGEVSSRRIERWYYRLENYSFEVRYRKGEDQGNADALSRCCALENEQRIAKNCTESEIVEIIKKTHKELIHRGSKCTLQKVHELYGDITCLEKVKGVLSNCLKCKEFRPRNYSGIKFHEAFEVGEKVAIDFLGPIQDYYILTGIDYFSRKGFAKALKTRETKKIIEFIKAIDSGIKIKTLVCDNAKEFLGLDLKKWAEENKVAIHYTTPYHHHSNGRVERFNRTIREGLSLSECKGPVKVKLYDVLKVYNSVVHSGTGVSPNDALNPENWSDLRRKEYESRIEQYRKYAKPVKLVKFLVDQKVLVQEDIVENKQNLKYSQGGTIIRILENDTYEVLHDGRLKKKYASQLRAMPI
jgi:hypothetical protein